MSNDTKSAGHATVTREEVHGILLDWRSYEHLTRYAQGTVTLITRRDREAADIAKVAWYGAPHEQPPFVNPYPATPESSRQ